jgi:hypothetical protein
MKKNFFKSYKQHKILTIHINENLIKLRTASTTKYCKIEGGEFIRMNTIAHFEDDCDLEESVYYMTRVN